MEEFLYKLKFGVTIKNVLNAIFSIVGLLIVIQVARLNNVKLDIGSLIIIILLILLYLEILDLAATLRKNYKKSK